MSHKTIYIDIDEEITSIVDRVRKAQANEVIVVVPKRALLLQSLVNLKLLKKESNRRKKQLMIVTQDRIGKKLIEKAGILVQGKMNDSYDDEEMVSNSPASASRVIAEDVFQEENEDEIIGSNDYFDEPLPKVSGKRELDEGNIGNIVFDKNQESEEKKGRKKGQSEKNIVEKEKNQKEKRGNMLKMTDIVMGPRQKKIKKIEKSASDLEEKNSDKKRAVNYFHFRETERLRNIKPNDFFQVSSNSSRSLSRKEEKALKITKVKGRSGKYFILFLIVFLLFASFAAAFFLLPRATVVLHMRTEEKNVAFDVEARTDISNVDTESGKIPAQIIEVLHSGSEEFEATGSKSGAGKASGKVVIYNEFSSEDQTLVATTRLETNDGKIFRITKNIVVPGVAKVGGESKPGAVEAEVVANKPGDEYNIDPTTFKVTGFKGGPKFDKFYAKSDEAMKEGLKGETAIVTSQDIVVAKEKTIESAQKEALKKLKDQLGSDDYLFENVAKTEIEKTASSKSIGSQAEKYSFSVDLKVVALTFRKNDIEKMIEQREKLGELGLSRITFGKEPSYILAENNIEGGSLNFGVKADVDITGGIDLDNFKKGLLGKSESELESLVKSYPSIKSADVNFWPFFVSRVPISEKKVNIEIQ